MRICGIDEVGRGAWAGPLVAAAVVVPHSRWHLKTKIKVRDSKLLTAYRRRLIFRKLKQNPVEIAVEEISTRQINSRGMAWANREIVRKLIKKFEANKFIVDGNLRLGRIAGKTDKIKCVVDADAKIEAVMLASIVAKVTRDKLMRELDTVFPKYHWKSNKGYGTRAHREALEKYGTTRYHRSLYVTTGFKKKSLTLK